MNELREVIIEMLSERRVFPLDVSSTFKLKFDRTKGYFIIDGKFKVANCDIPVDNLEARINHTEIVTLSEIQVYINQKNYQK